MEYYEFHIVQEAVMYSALFAIMYNYVTTRMYRAYDSGGFAGHTHVQLEALSPLHAFSIVVCKKKIHRAHETISGYATSGAL